MILVAPLFWGADGHHLLQVGTLLLTSHPRCKGGTVAMLLPNYSNAFSWSMMMAELGDDCHCLSGISILGTEMLQSVPGIWGVLVQF